MFSLLLASSPLQGISEAVLVAFIGAAGAAFGGVATIYRERLKREADDAVKDAEYAHEKIKSADEAFKELRESQQRQIAELQGRLDSQWREIEKLREEKSVYEVVRVTLLEVMLAFPNPPGPPRISTIAANAIGWEDNGKGIGG